MMGISDIFQVQMKVHEGWWLGLMLAVVLKSNPPWLGGDKFPQDS